MIARCFLLVGCVLAATVAVLWGTERIGPLGPVVVGMFAAFALSVQGSAALRSFAFTFWVLAFVAAAMFYPWMFGTWGKFELRVLIVPLIQLIMFGMGTTLNVGDFVRVLAMPKAVLIGMVLQFTVMPVAGAAIAMAYGFEPEVAAGVVLVGSCPGGVASNVMTYLARGNVALSVSMTASSTLVSPLMTPIMMKLLANQYVEIVFLDMMWTIVKIIIFPIVAGLIVNKILETLRLRGKWLDQLLSVVAMAAICFILGIIVSLSREDLLTVGVALIGAAILHNAIGYILGYGGAWMLGLQESDRRTVAIEVGLQNGGMATGLAMNVLKSSSAALAPAIFGTWMNISGSVLASWWRSRPVTSEATAQDEDVVTAQIDSTPE